MAESTSFPSLGWRLKALLLNAAIFYAAYIIATERTLPTGGLESAWLLSALALWFLTLLSAPWFLPPRDGLISAVGAALVSMTIDLSAVKQFQQELDALRWLAVGYCAVVAAIAIVALFVHDKDMRAPAGRLAYRLNAIFGKGEILFTLPALISILGAYARGAKVFCVDFTGDYRQRLADLNPAFPSPPKERIEDLEKKLFDVATGTWGAKDEKKVLSAAMDGLRAYTANEINNFLVANNPNLAVLELAEIANTRATLRLTELYLSTIMAWARQYRRARQVMIVLEEAHTIVPETIGAGFDAETQNVVSRIGQIALQGRKYGVGLLVVTQRTALVSKTILSQCNTFLTHSLIDQTSLNFLENVYSTQHVRLVPNLPNLHFLAFGKALRAERPIMLRREFNQKKKDASERLRRPLPNAELVPPAAAAPEAKQAAQPESTHAPGKPVAKA